MPKTATGVHHLLTEEIDNTLLALMHRDGAGAGRLKPSLVNLPLGPICTDHEEGGTWMYFPVDALIGLAPADSSQAAVALVGRQGCVMSPGGELPMHAHVVSPGQAYRLDWGPVRQDPNRFAPWLWHASAATQSLIGQMAQWSFCAKHHSPDQRLASWLLHGLAQTPHAELTLSLMGLPLDMQQWLSRAEPAAVEKSDAQGYVVGPDGVLAQSSERLMAQACACHAGMPKLSSDPR